MNVTNDTFKCIEEFNIPLGRVKTKNIFDQIFSTKIIFETKFPLGPIKRRHCTLYYKIVHYGQMRYISL